MFILQEYILQTFTRCSSDNNFARQEKNATIMLWIVQYYGKLLLIIINHAMVFIYKSQYIWPE